MTGMGPQQFAFFRICLGAYLAGFGLLLLPYSTELLSSEGIYGFDIRGFRWFDWVLPTVLGDDPSPAVARAAVSGLIVAGLALAAGFYRRVAALLGWYLLACIVDRDLGLLSPSIPFVGWLLIATLLVPAGEGWSVLQRAPTSDWIFPKALFRASWIVMAIAYSLSGFAKLQTPEWIDGTALQYAFGLPFAREGGLTGILLALPDVFVRLLTWMALLGEVAFAPLSLFSLGRLVAWVVMVAMHLMLLATMAFPELSLGMLLIHVFTFDRRWFA